MGDGDISKKSWLRSIRRRGWLRTVFYIDGKLAAAAGLALVILVVGVAGTIYRNSMSAKIDPAAYAPLLNTIAKGESNGNYNAYFGHASNTDLRFTDMTVAEVLKWQKDYVDQGSVSSAVGKYQIIRPTLVSLVKKLDIDTGAKFDETMQDRMAVALLEKRGSEDYFAKKLTRQEFAANLAKEWAALPKIIGPNPEQSYYAGDGINKVRISIDEIYKALAAIES